MATIGEDDDPVGKSQAVAAFGELAGQEAVPRYETGQEREAVEACITPRVEDKQGGELHHVEQGVPSGPEPNTACASCEMTVGAPAINGAACVHLARNEVPRTKEPRVTLIRR